MNADAHPFDLVRHLVRRGISLVVIGGHAVNFHGHIRSTEDVDLIIKRTPAADRHLFDVLSDANAYWISNEIDASTGIEKTIPVTLDYVRETRLMMLGSDYGYLDLFDFVPGIPDQAVGELIDSAEVVDSIPFVSLDWLKRMKRAAGRPIDIIDLQHLP